VWSSGPERKYRESQDEGKEYEKGVKFSRPCAYVCAQGPWKVGVKVKMSGESESESDGSH
jgi:hypothetical protein